MVKGRGPSAESQVLKCRVPRAESQVQSSKYKSAEFQVQCPKCKVLSAEFQAQSSKQTVISTEFHAHCSKHSILDEKLKAQSSKHKILRTKFQAQNMYIMSAQNIADISIEQPKAEDLLENPNWGNGPEFLMEPKLERPSQKPVLNIMLKETMRKELILHSDELKLKLA